jgi:predicted kinase
VSGLSHGLQLPLIAKDDIKESLFESLGWSDIDWSRKLGAASWEIIFLLAEKLLEGGASFVFEANFDPERHGERFRELMKRHPFVPVEVHMTLSEESLRERFEARITDTDRHPGHHEPKTPEEAAIAARDALRRHLPHNLGPHVFVVKTDEGDVDVAVLVEEIRASLS